MSSLLSAPKSSQPKASQSLSRRSNRVSPVRRDTSFIPTSGDSRRSLYIPDEDDESNTGADEDPSEEGDPSEDEIIIEPRAEPVEQTTPTQSLPRPKKRTSESQVQAQKVKKPRKSDAKGKGTRAKVTDFTVPKEVDVDQVSPKARPIKPFRTQSKGVTHLLSYFHPEPVHVEHDEPPGMKRGYLCKFCPETCTRGTDGNSNLYGHRDGGKNRLPCKGRSNAMKLKDHGLPPTYQERNKTRQEVSAQSSSAALMTSFVNRPPFNIDVLNVLLVIWVLRHALPWVRFQDPTLRAAFHLTHAKADLRSPTWAATTAKELYSSLYDQLIMKIKDNRSKICLVHDGWTTKGNRLAFIGVTATWIDSKWKYRSSHLTLKLATWHHCGALLARPVGKFLIKHDLHKKVLAHTTDLGANNKTMADELEKMFMAAEESVYWDSSANHVRCYCHKLALVVKHGLKTMNISVGHVKPSTQPGASVPVPTLILNTGNDELDVPSLSDEDDAGLVPTTTDPDCEDDESAPQEPGNTTELVKRALLKCDKVISLICSSSSRRQWFNSRAKSQGLKSIIHGWGVRWNAKADSRRRAAAGHEIINAMLHTDSKSNRFFRGLIISEEEWNAVREVNKVLEVFERATKRMEGDFSSGCKVLSEYRKVQNELHVLQQNSVYPSLDTMITEMLKHLKQYANEAAETEVVQIATILNPRH